MEILKHWEEIMIFANTCKMESKKYDGMVSTIPYEKEGKYKKTVISQPDQPFLCVGESLFADKMDSQQIETGRP